MRLLVVGGGLAGSEAAWQAAECGIEVDLWEARPELNTPAHLTSLLGELVCSNSLGSDTEGTPAGLLKQELRRLGSLVMRAADAHRVPAGRALAVDREAFAAQVTAAVMNHPKISLHRGEVVAIPSQPAIIASGPLTSEKLAASVASFSGQEALYFYDAAAPVVEAATVNPRRSFWGNRYEADASEGYLNCPLTKSEYEDFVAALVAAETVPLEVTDRLVLFEGCLPVEEIARRGPDTLRFGPLKPVGLCDPATGRRPWAVIQLRREDTAGRLFNLVGFQTRLRWGEQDRVFRTIPALEAVEFVRYGVMHRNTFINAPRVLLPTYQSQRREDLFFAGQLTGVEGYLESTASGLMAGLNAARLLRGQAPVVPPETTMIGGLSRFITSDRPSVQPMNANFGILPPLEDPPRDKREKRKLLCQRAEAALEMWEIA